jgi:hypothetical protein
MARLPQPVHGAAACVLRLPRRHSRPGGTVGLAAYRRGHSTDSGALSPRACGRSTRPSRTASHAILPMASAHAPQHRKSPGISTGGLREPGANPGPDGLNTPYGFTYLLYRSYSVYVSIDRVGSVPCTSPCRASTASGCTTFRSPTPGSRARCQNRWRATRRLRSEPSRVVNAPAARLSGRPIQACPVDSPAAHRIPRATDPTLEDTNMGNEATVGDVSAAINQNLTGRIQIIVSAVSAFIAVLDGLDFQKIGHSRQRARCGVLRRGRRTGHRRVRDQPARRPDRPQTSPDRFDCLVRRIHASRCDVGFGDRAAYLPPAGRHRAGRGNARLHPPVLRIRPGPTGSPALAIV